jgi:hypothetical protein
MMRDPEIACEMQKPSLIPIRASLAAHSLPAMRHRHEDHLAPVSTVEAMVDRSRKFHAGIAGHAGSFPASETHHRERNSEPHPIRRHHK